MSITDFIVGCLIVACIFSADARARIGVSAAEIVNAYDAARAAIAKVEGEE